jgi:hypothetical protein
MKNLFTIICILSCFSVYSQGSWGGKFYFNLIFKNGEKVSLTDFRKGNLYILSNVENSFVKYDTGFKCFIYNSPSLPYLGREFYIFSKSDTVRIEFPGLNEKCIYPKSPIKISCNSYNFQSTQIIDFMTNNESIIKKKDLDEIFYFNKPTVTKFSFAEEIKKPGTYLFKVVIEYDK